MRPTWQHVSVLLVLLSGCGTQHPTISPTPGEHGRTEGLSPQFRIAVLAGESMPATYSFQQAKGKLVSARAGLADSAEIAVTGPAQSIMVSGLILDGTIRSAQDERALSPGAALAGAATRSRE